MQVDQEVSNNEANDKPMENEITLNINNET
jgi:hypothetical protein